jgi:hypothetical protein
MVLSSHMSGMDGEAHAHTHAESVNSVVANGACFVGR